MKNELHAMLYQGYLTFLTHVKQPWQNLKYFLLEYELTNKIILYVKGEGTNLNTLTIALTNVIVSYAPLGPSLSYIDTCFGHVTSKACQYMT